VVQADTVNEETWKAAGEKEEAAATVLALNGLVHTLQKEVKCLKELDPNDTTVRMPLSKQRELEAAPGEVERGSLVWAERVTSCQAGRGGFPLYERTRRCALI
jgi:hypothetical protein